MDLLEQQRLTDADKQRADSCEDTGTADNGTACARQHETVSTRITGSKDCLAVRSGMSKNRRIAVCFAGAAAALAIAAALASGNAFAAGGSSSSSSSSSSSTGSSTITASSADEDTSLAEQVAAKCLPSVGTVTAAISTPSVTGTAQGSCVVLDTEGHLITNYHVIEGATEVVVTLNDEVYNATIVGADPSSDIAVLKIDPGDTELTPMEIGDSDDINIGEWVMTLGTPKGMEQSVATGIVSGTNRSTVYELETTVAYYPGLIQTDAMINSGSSGGALVNAQGELIGITTINYSSDGDFAGIADAIPSNYAISIAKQIIETGTVEHPFLGVRTTDVNPTNYKDADSESYFGAYVVSVEAGTPAEKAGLQAGDIITSVDGQTIYSTTYLTIAIRSHEIGDTIPVTVDRDGEELTLEVTLGSDVDYLSAIASGSDSASGSSQVIIPGDSDSSGSTGSTGSTGTAPGTGSTGSTGSVGDVFNVPGSTDGSAGGSTGSSTGSSDSSSSQGSTDMTNSNGYGYGFEDYPSYGNSGSSSYGYGYSYPGYSGYSGYSGGDSYGYSGYGSGSGSNGYGYSYGSGSNGSTGGSGNTGYAWSFGGF